MLRQSFVLAFVLVAVTATTAVPTTLTTAAAQPAAAQPTDYRACPERRHVLRLMADRFEQMPVAMGLARNGDLLELLTNPDNGDWTILTTSPDGRSCQLAAGTAWQNLIATPLAEPDA